MIGEDMSRLGWQETELACRLMNDPGKLAVAARARQETTLPVKWIAEHLQMGTSKSLKPMLLRWTQACGRSANRVRLRGLRVSVLVTTMAPASRNRFTVAPPRLAFARPGGGE